MNPSNRYSDNKTVVTGSYTERPKKSINMKLSTSELRLAHDGPEEIKFRGYVEDLENKRKKHNFSEVVDYSFQHQRIKNSKFSMVRNSSGSELV